MGKLLVIIILMVTAVFATLSVSINNRKVEAPELVSSSMSQIKAKNTSNEGLHYAIKQINQGIVSLDDFVEVTGGSNGNGNGNNGNGNNGNGNNGNGNNGNGNNGNGNNGNGNNGNGNSNEGGTTVGSQFTQTFSNFDVLDGTIDSINYVMNTTVDTLTITCYASSYISGRRKHFSSSAQFLYSAGTPAKTFVCSKGITINGNGVINGEKEEYASMNFQATFGKTMAQMKSMADHYYRNPSTNKSPVNGITYVDFSNSNKKMQLSNWTGEGILIVDGNIQMDGWSTFNGVLWVEGGYFKTSGHATINGAVYVNTNNTVKMTGNSSVNENETIVNSLMGTQSGSSSSNLEIISWIN